MLLILIIVLLLGLCALSTVGRTGHPGVRELRKWFYAHRGLHCEGVPENSLEAFRRAKEAGYGMELDVHLLADGNLSVIHDSGLKRTTGSDGIVEDLTVRELGNYYLEGSDQTIPEFQQVLELVGGKVPLIVELKCVGNNYAALCETACKILDRYDGAYCMESFDPRCVYWLKKNRPDVIRGQLTENYFASSSARLPWLLKFLLKNQTLNFLTRPDFVAYKYCDRKTFSNTLCRKFWKIQGVTWTVKTREEFDTAVSENWIPIFENFTP